MSLPKQEWWENPKKMPLPKPLRPKKWSKIVKMVLFYCSMNITSKILSTLHVFEGHLLLTKSFAFAFTIALLHIWRRNRFSSAIASISSQSHWRNFFFRICDQRHAFALKAPYTNNSCAPVHLHSSEFYRVLGFIQDRTETNHVCF